MSLVKRMNPIKKSNELDLEFLHKVKDLIFLFRAKGMKSSKIYPALKKELRPLGYKPFKIFSHYITWQELEKGQSYEKAWKIGLGVAGKRAQSIKRK